VVARGRRGQPGRKGNSRAGMIADDPAIKHTASRSRSMISHDDAARMLGPTWNARGFVRDERQLPEEISWRVNQRNTTKADRS